MRISLEMDSRSLKTIAELSAAGTNITLACSAGLAKGGKIAANRVISEHMEGQDLKTRKGDLKRAVDAWMEAPLDGVVGVREKSAVDKYKYLLGTEIVTITAKKKGGFLAIPQPDAQSGAGVLKAEYRKPLKTVPGLFVLKSKSGGLYLAKKFGKTDRSIHLLFVLKHSVVVQGTGALLAGVLDSVDDITKSITDEIDKKI